MGTPVRTLYVETKETDLVAFINDKYCNSFIKFTDPKSGRERYYFKVHKGGVFLVHRFDSIEMALQCLWNFYYEIPDLCFNEMETKTVTFTKPKMSYQVYDLDIEDNNKGYYYDYPNGCISLKCYHDIHKSAVKDDFKSKEIAIERLSYCGIKAVFIPPVVREPRKYNPLLTEQEEMNIIAENFKPGEIEKVKEWHAQLKFAREYYKDPSKFTSDSMESQLKRGGYHYLKEFFPELFDTSK